MSPISNVDRLETCKWGIANIYDSNYKRVTTTTHASQSNTYQPGEEYINIDLGLLSTRT